MKLFEKFILVLCGSVIIFISACNSDHRSSGDVSPTTLPNQESQNPPATVDSQKEKKSISFKKFGIIREYGGTDNAALFKES